MGIRDNALAFKFQLLYFLPLAAAVLWYLDVPCLRFLPPVITFYRVHASSKSTLFLFAAWTSAGFVVMLPGCWVALSAVAGAPAGLGDAMAITVSLIPVEICVTCKYRCSQ